MINSKRLLAAAAAVAMLSASTGAVAANPAASLSVAKAVRAGSPATHDAKLGAAVPGTTLISIGVLAVLVVVVLVATKKSNPKSA